MYALRPVLCCDWIVRNLTQPPMHLEALLPETVPDRRMARAVEDLVEIKRDQSEKSEVERSPAIENYLRERMADLEDRIPKNPSKLPMEEFDRVFRQILALLWG
jgi:predicted nucleotidyltransferase